MEAQRFDTLARSVASRRGLLARIVGGGFAAALLTSIGLRPADAADDLVNCVLDLRAAVRLGPSAGIPLITGATEAGKIAGKLEITIAKGGNLSNSLFRLSEGTELFAVGEAPGHRLHLRIALGDGRALVLQGVGEHNLRSCKGAVDGSLIGPAEGDLGDWHATAQKVEPATPLATAATSGAATQTPADDSNSDDTGYDSDSGGTDNSGCPELLEQCGTACCFKGSLCDESSSSCACPGGTSVCQEICMPNCPDGQAYDLSTCECVALPKDCPGGQILCNGVCVAGFSDRHNCGGCGIDCGDHGICQGGQCVSCGSGVSCNGLCCSLYSGYSSSATSPVSCDPITGGCQCWYYCDEACGVGSLGSFPAIPCEEDPSQHCQECRVP